MDLTLPLDYAAIERILPHRYPFLLVDRITEFEVDKRIVGIKNVSLNERYLSHGPDGSPVLPPTILTEAVAQVGAILILAKPENRQRLRSSRASSASATAAGPPRRRRGDRGGVLRLRSRMGVLNGVGARRREGRHRRHDDLRARPSAARAGVRRQVARLTSAARS